MWTSDELDRIGNAEELEIISRRQDGTLGKPTIIWVVRVGDALYVRPVGGHSSGWFRATQVRHEGRIRAGGIEKDVTFAVETGGGVNEQIDAAYNAKYGGRYPMYVPPVLTPQARAATIRLVPAPIEA